jgi:two-component system, chemotaxis family, protein-glutamate methylesterase/glutaminase
VHTVAVGASAGGVEALRQLVGALPADYPAAVLVVLHVAPVATSVLPQILQRAGELPAKHAVDGEAVEGGRIYVAPPDLHLVVADGMLSLDHGPRVNGHRPAIDPLFRSVAREWGAGAAGVILSGVLDDGTAGLMAIKRAGGLTFAQDPEEALYAMMPRHAIEFVRPDCVGTARDLGLSLARLAVSPPPKGAHEQPARTHEETFIEVDRGSSDHAQGGDPTGLSCPDCHGGIWESVENGVAHYRCRVGHEYTTETFAIQQSERVENALWTALRTLEERGALNRRIASRQRGRGNMNTAERFERRADRSVENAVMLRQLLRRFVADKGAA